MRFSRSDDVYSHESDKIKFGRRVIYDMNAVATNIH